MPPRVPRRRGMAVDAGDTAFMLMSTALVMLMTVGLAFFYGGFVRRKNVLAIMMQSFAAFGVVTVVWILVGYSLAFGQDQGGFIGSLQYAVLTDVGGDPHPRYGTTIPALVFLAFQLMFAIITPALITGAIADRMRFSAWVWFIGLWAVLVYAPIAHWVFSPSGWLFKRGALDFAGGTVVHINAGIAALAAVFILGKRRGWPD